MLHLRLHEPEAEDPAETYLRDFFETFVVPQCLAGRSAGTLKWYRTTLSYFEAAACGLPKPPKQCQRRQEWERRRDELRSAGRGDPTLARLWQAGGETVRRFAAWLEAHVRESNTRRTHLQNLAVLLERAGPKRRRGQVTAELFDGPPPEVRLPDLVVRDVIDQFTLKELGWFLDACGAALWRRRALAMDAARFLRNLVLFDYNVGLRIGTLLAARFDWCLEDEYGAWLAIPAAAMKGRKRGLTVYLNRHAVEIVERMRALGSERIFPYPCGAGHLDRLRQEILRASRIPPERHKQLGFHALRKACGTQLARINPLASRLQLGHGARDVTIDHYIHRATVLPEACERLPQPAWDGRQKRLF